MVGRHYFILIGGHIMTFFQTIACEKMAELGYTYDKEQSTEHSIRFNKDDYYRLFNSWIEVKKFVESELTY
jgi:hypothetical protein